MSTNQLHLLEKYIFKKINNDALFDFHIKRTIYYAKILAKKYGISSEKAVMGALLHDIDGIIARTKNDFENSQRIAKNILKKFGYDELCIREIQNVILTHSSGSIEKPKTKLEQIIANADALSHFEMIPLYFYGRQNLKNFQEALHSVQDKLNRSQKKITLGEAKKIAIPLRQKARETLRLYEYLSKNNSHY